MLESISDSDNNNNNEFPLDYAQPYQRYETFNLCICSISYYVKMVILILSKKYTFGSIDYMIIKIDKNHRRLYLTFQYLSLNRQTVVIYKKNNIKRMKR